MVKVLSCQKRDLRYWSGVKLEYLYYQGTVAESRGKLPANPIRPHMETDVIRFIPQVLI